MKLRVAVLEHQSHVCRPNGQLSIRASRSLHDQRELVVFLTPQDNFLPSYSQYSLEQRRRHFFQRCTASDAVLPPVLWNDVELKIGSSVKESLWEWGALQIQLITNAIPTKSKSGVQQVVETHIACLDLSFAVLTTCLEKHQTWIALEPINGKCTLVLDLAKSEWPGGVSWLELAHVRRAESVRVAQLRQSQSQVMYNSILDVNRQIWTLTPQNKYSRYFDRGNNQNMINLGATSFWSLSSGVEPVMVDLYRGRMPGPAYIQSILTLAPRSMPSSPTLFQSMLYLTAFQLGLEAPPASAAGLDDTWLCLFLGKWVSSLAATLVYFADCEDLCLRELKCDLEKVVAVAAVAAASAAADAEEVEVQLERMLPLFTTCCLSRHQERKGRRKLPHSKEKPNDEYYLVGDTPNFALGADDCETLSAFCMLLFLCLQQLHKLPSTPPLLRALSLLAQKYVPMLVVGTIIKANQAGSVSYDSDHEEEKRFLASAASIDLRDQPQMRQRQQEKDDKYNFVCHVHLLLTPKSIFRAQLVPSAGSKASMAAAAVSEPTLLVEATESSFPIQDAKQLPASVLAVLDEKKWEQARDWRKRLFQLAPSLNVGRFTISIAETQGYNIYLSTTMAYVHLASLDPDLTALAGTGELRLYDKTTKRYSVPTPKLLDPAGRLEVALVPVVPKPSAEVLEAFQQLSQFLPPPSLPLASCQPFSSRPPQAPALAGVQRSDTPLHLWYRHIDWTPDMEKEMARATAEMGLVYEVELVHLTRGQQLVLVRFKQGRGKA